MRARLLIKHELYLLYKYGILYAYLIFTIFYAVLLSAIPESAKETTGIILVLTDPAAMGLFFMGAIILLEKSQHAHCSLAVTPITQMEYIWAKLISLSLFGLAVGLLVGVCAGIRQLASLSIAILLASILMSMCGLIVACKTSSLNQFLIATVPFEIVIFIPALLYLFDLLQSDLWLLHPGVASIRLILGGNSLQTVVSLISLCTFDFFVFVLCKRSVKQYFCQMEGGTL